MAPLYAPPHSPRNDTQGAYDTLTPSVIMISGNSHEGNLKGEDNGECLLFSIGNFYVDFPFKNVTSGENTNFFQHP